MLNIKDLKNEIAGSELRDVEGGLFYLDGRLIITKASRDETARAVKGGGVKFVDPVEALLNAPRFYGYG